VLSVRIEHHRVHVGDRFSVSFQRTLRIPDDGRTYPLPPGLGLFPVHPVEQFGERVPALWREAGGFVIPMYQREALWLGFDGADWKPNAVKVGVGRINAVTGEPWRDGLHARPQDYIVTPDQPWLDGINAGGGIIRQFVAMPMGAGYTVEEQLTGASRFGGIQIQVFEPKPGRFPDKPLRAKAGHLEAKFSMPSTMGVAAGGRMKQKIYPDAHGLDVWDQTRFASLTVHIVNSEDYRALTGQEPPPTPIDAATYTQHGFPWFDLYDENRPTLDATERLRRIKSVSGIDTDRGKEQEETTFEVPTTQVKKL
jgi:hypothetical protein